MPACPHCHVFKGLWSPMTQNSDGQFICKINVTHKFTRDQDGNFHALSGG